MAICEYPLYSSFPLSAYISFTISMEAIKYIIGQGELLTGYLLTYDALKMEFRKVKLPSDTNNCAVCGDHPTITELIDYEQAECDGVHL